jgi:hypothetical protein
LGGVGFPETGGGVAAGGVVAGGGDESPFDSAVAPVLGKLSDSMKLLTFADTVCVPATVQIASRNIETQRCVFIDWLLIRLDVLAMARHKSQLRSTAAAAER